MAIASAQIMYPIVDMNVCSTFARVAHLGRDIVVGL